ncbi:hypothetical protein Rmar_0171 [Rhodothermus marinus DSM 4252]|uniref:Uncharacterized protein n=2 Tax=Rhodothermus marinus TaxID=29549 RepID=D0MCW9_RHOM4|nr:hypothetical protein Rmar_0171 [Rhodothermus marinus DSM 4252]
MCFIEQYIIRKNIKESYPRDWDEDFITRSLLKSLRTELPQPTSIHLHPYTKPDLRHHKVEVKWDAYKMTGGKENKFGDVAILVVTKYPDGDTIKGVAFLEAKKRYKNSSHFRAIDFEQLKRITDNAPRASLLLYDFNIINQYWWPTYIVTVPADLVIATHKKDISLYKFSKPFSAALLNYLLGFDLEHTEKALSIAKGYQTEYGTPLYLMVIRVGIGTEPPSDNEVDFNRNYFVRLEE